MPAFVPPPLSSHEGLASDWTPPPLSAHEDPPEPKGFWATLGSDIANAPKHVMDFLSGHPLGDTLQFIKDTGAQREAHTAAATAAYKAGDYKTAAEQALFSIPFLGTGMASTIPEWESGQKGAAGAHLFEQAAGILGPSAVRAVTPVVRATGAGMAAAAPGIVGGATKIAAGEALGAVAPGMEWPGRLALGYPGARQVAGGFQAGAQAFRAALAGGASPEAAMSQLMEDLSQSLGGKSFANLSESQQVGIRAVANRITNGLPLETATPKPGVVNPGTPIGGKTAAQMLQEELAAAKAPPAAVQRGAPLWSGVPATAPAPTPEFASVPSTLPSGRIPGTGTPPAAPAVTVTPQRAPIWAGMPAAESAPLPGVSPIPSPLPSGRIPGTGVAAGPAPVVPPVGVNVPLRPPLRPATAPAPTPLPTPTSAPAVAPAPAAAGPPSIAQMLAEEMAKSGTIPAGARVTIPAPEPAIPPETYAGAARAARADKAASLAGALHSADIPASDLGAMSKAEWKTVAEGQKIEWPTGKAAQEKLIRDATNAKLGLEAGQPATVSKMMEAK